MMFLPQRQRYQQEARQSGAVEGVSNELRQGHHVTSQKSAYLRVARQMN
jgi:hypothetical protein